MAHRALTRCPIGLNRLVLLLERLPGLRRRVLRVFGTRPPLFRRFLDARRGSLTAAWGPLLQLGWGLVVPGR
jgi:hypothetical protein